MVRIMIEIIAPALWACFTAYIIWYFTKAKNYAPITPNDARILWKIHRQSIHCDAKKWQVVRRGGKIVGFQCDCGYRHVEKRPIVGGLPAPRESQIDVSDRISGLPRPAGARRN